MKGLNQTLTTIVEQLGGAGKLEAMTGAYNFTARDENTLQFNFKASKKANKIIIEYLPGEDLYNVTFFLIRNLKFSIVAEYKSIYNHQLIPLFEKTTGLYLSL